uniref:ATPase family AAA domain containing 5b n=1 Tax=Astyanax mexicanus TaxID=7994 RepID=A0A8B9LQA4_ASTMX
TCEELLEQIQAQNPRFAVHQFFSLLQKRGSQFKKSFPGLGKSSDTQIRTGFISKDGDLNKAPSKSRLSVSRRRKQQNPAPSAVLHPEQSVCSTGEKAPLECVTRMREEDVLWTEKYQPQHSGGIIGNSASVGKLHSWLKEWRMRADVEERRRRREERCRMQEENSESWDCGDFVGESLMIEDQVELCNTVLIVGPVGVGKTAAVYACAEELGYKVFEVNSSSLRSGQLVLSQLREATQSHQLGALRPDSPKPHSSLSTDAVELPASRAAPAATFKETSRKAVASSKKSSRSVPRNKSSAPAVTIKHFFKRTDRPVNKISDLQQDHQGMSENPKFDYLMHFILYFNLQVDIIFSEDVGFLTAIKTLMTTTKRPIILTTNDPLFSKTFNGHFEKIYFKTPSEITRSYLQCLCVVENVWPDPEDLSFLLEECKGDVRRSVLELELWACSGGGQTHQHNLNKTLTCGSWAELDSSESVDVLVENWRMGRSLFYSNLELLFSSHSRSSENMDKKNIFNADKSIKFSSSKCFHVLFDRFNQSSCPATRIDQLESISAEKSLSKVKSCYLESVAQFFDTMSFLCTCIYKQKLQVRVGQCQPGPLGWMGAHLTDSLVDELREDGVNTHLEKSYEFLSVLEGLGFHQCRAELSEAQRTLEKLTAGIGGERLLQLTEELISESSDAHVSQNKPSVALKRRREVLNKLLSSKAFCCHGNKKAVAVDYLPALRSICRSESVKQFIHYLSDIRLPLPKSVFQLLASDLH